MTFLLPLLMLAASGCGKMESRVVTADLLKAGSPDLYEATLPFSSTYPGHDTETYPIGNIGFRAATIHAIRFSNTRFTLDPSNTCVVGAEIQPGTTCEMSIRFTPTVAAGVDATLTIEYDGAGQSFSSDYPLHGIIH